MRTEMGPVVQHVNKKWSVSFNTYAGNPGGEYLANTATSAPVFDSEDAAYAGGERAMTVLEDTGKWPNMCEVF